MKLDIKKLIDWLGPKGATAGLENGEVTQSELRELAMGYNISTTSKAKRTDIIRQIIDVLDKRIEKTVPEMLGMNYDELIAFFEDVRPSKRELLVLLSELEFNPGSEAKKSLYKYAARQISETGMFQRVAKTPNRRG